MVKFATNYMVFYINFSHFCSVQLLISYLQELEEENEHFELSTI